MKHRLSVFASTLLGAVLCLGCDSSPASVNVLPACDPVAPRPPCTPKPADPTLERTLQIVEGDTQVANAGSALPTPLTVRVTDRNGAPVKNTGVIWSGSNGVSLSTTMTTTDANGLTRMQATLGSAAGEFPIDAKVQSFPTAAVRFVAVAQVNGAFRISDITGQGVAAQFDTVRSRKSPYKVKVTNWKGAPVAGVVVAWQLAGNGSLSALTTTTDVEGMAEVTHTLGSRVGAEVTQASAAGLVGSPFAFITYATAGKSVSLIYVSGNDQVNLVGVEAVQPYVVRSLDAYGNATSGEVVWSVTSGGGSIRIVNPLTAVHKLGPAGGIQTVAAQLPAAGLEISFRINAVNVFVGVGGDPYCYYSNIGFNPALVTVPVGSVVGWVFYQGYYCFSQHDLIFEDETGGSSPAHTSNFTRAFPVAGTYRYRCTRHSTDFDNGEVGAVTVR